MKPRLRGDRKFIVLDKMSEELRTYDVPVLHDTDAGRALRYPARVTEDFAEHDGYIGDAEYYLVDEKLVLICRTIENETGWEDFAPELHNRIAFAEAYLKHPEYDPVTNAKDYARDVNELVLIASGKMSRK